MGWLSKIFKGSNHEVVEEHNYDGYAEDPIRNTSSTSGVKHPNTLLHSF